MPCNKHTEGNHWCNDEKHSEKHRSHIRPKYESSLQEEFLQKAKTQMWNATNGLKKTVARKHSKLEIVFAHKFRLFYRKTCVHSGWVFHKGWELKIKKKYSISQFTLISIARMEMRYQRRYRSMIDDLWLPKLQLLKKLYVLMLLLMKILALGRTIINPPTSQVYAQFVSNNTNWWMKSYKTVT